MTLILSNIGDAVLSAREGDRLVSYQDSVGVWTIGRGVTRINGRPVRKGMTITRQESAALFRVTLIPYVNLIASVVKVPLAANESDALISVCYNIGQEGMKSSTMIRRLNKGDRSGCAEAMLFWNKPPEIRSRRQAEHDQFLTPYKTSLPKARSSDAHPIVMPKDITS